MALAIYCNISNISPDALFLGTNGVEGAIIVRDWLNEKDSFVKLVRSSGRADSGISASSADKDSIRSGGMKAKRGITVRGGDFGEKSTRNLANAEVFVASKESEKVGCHEAPGGGKERPFESLFEISIWVGARVTLKLLSVARVCDAIAVQAFFREQP